VAKGRIRQGFKAFGQNWSMTAKSFPYLWAEILGIIIVVGVIVATPVWLFVNPITGILIALPISLLVATYWFSRRAMTAAYSSIEGQPGAAAAVIQSIRGNKWAVTPAVAINKSQDMVSRVVGKPGVILISEGPGNRVTSLLANERKKTARWVADIPIYEIQVGTEADQVSLKKLQKTLTKLPRNLRGGEITEVRRRLDALGNAANGLPIPKGPIPTSARSIRRPRSR
jgi:hypothetical protein